MPINRSHYIKQFSYLSFCAWILATSVVFERVLWVSDLVVQLLLHIIFGLSGLLIMGIILRIPTILKVGLAVPLLFLCSYLSFTTAKDFENPPPTRKIKIISINLNSQNQQFEKFEQYILESAPDIIVLIELSGRWGPTINKLKSLYPQLSAIAQESNFGIGILSKLPLANTHKLLVGEFEAPILYTDIVTASGPFRIIAVHPYPPISPKGKTERDTYLQKAAELASGSKNPTVVCGDFNLTPWTKAMRTFEKTSGLARMTNTFLEPTWPSGFLLIGIPIDHCFISSDLKVSSYQRGRNIGSDHLPIEVGISLKSERN